ncbi:MAG: hypothetical protein A3J94_05440 [Syntrophus sp. RIFOXYC2_FULL_54_9]|nr:MAG: hypothetical protein A3J94_05440 [Syntrophus sp. RIFOXYC2_FULL_54_9]HBB15467.1 hypothetical protein [Syntrophus sp. (in: bacteria)]
MGTKKLRYPSSNTKRDDVWSGKITEFGSKACVYQTAFSLLLQRIGFFPQEVGRQFIAEKETFKTEQKKPPERGGGWIRLLFLKILEGPP